MRIFANITPTLKITRRISCNYNARQYTSLVQIVQYNRPYYNGNIWSTNHTLQSFYRETRTFNGTTDKRCKSGEVNDEMPAKEASSIMPVALIDVNPLSSASTKILLIPLNWSNDNEAMIKNTISSIFSQRRNIRQIEAFSNALRDLPEFQQTRNEQIVNKLEMSENDSEIPKFTENDKSLCNHNDQVELSPEYADSTAICVTEKPPPILNLTSIEPKPWENLFGLPENFGKAIQNLVCKNFGDSSRISETKPCVSLMPCAGPINNNEKGQPISLSVIMKPDVLKLNFDEFVFQRKLSSDPLSLATRSFSTKYIESLDQQKIISPKIFELPNSFKLNYRQKSNKGRQVSTKSTIYGGSKPSCIFRDPSSNMGSTEISPTPRKISNNSCKLVLYNSPFVSELLGGQQLPMSCDTYRKALIEAEKRRAALKADPPVKRLKDCVPDRPMVMTTPKIAAAKPSDLDSSAKMATGGCKEDDPCKPPRCPDPCRDEMERKQKLKEEAERKHRPKVPSGCVSPQCKKEDPCTKLKKGPCKKASGGDNTYMEVYGHHNTDLQHKQPVLQMSKAGAGGAGGKGSTGGKSSPGGSGSSGSGKGGGSKGKPEAPKKNKGKSKKPNPCKEDEKEYKPKCNIDPCCLPMETNPCQKPTAKSQGGDKKKSDPCAKKDKPKTDPCAKDKKKADSCTKKDDKKKSDPCAKKDDKKKKTDPCAKKVDKKKSDPCAKKVDKKKSDPCANKGDKKKSDPCAKKVDKKKSDSYAKKDDKKKSNPCAKKAEEKKPNPCTKKDDKKKTDPCSRKDKKKPVLCGKDKKKVDKKKSEQCLKKKTDDKKKADPCAKDKKKTADPCAKQKPSSSKQDIKIYDPCAKKDKKNTDPCGKSQKKQPESSCKQEKKIFDPCSKKDKNKSDPCGKKKKSDKKPFDPCGKKQKSNKPTKKCFSTDSTISQSAIDWKPKIKYFSTMSFKAPKTLIGSRTFNNNMSSFGFMRHFSSKDKKNKNEMDHGVRSKCKSLAIKKPPNRRRDQDPHPKDGLRVCYPAYDKECPRKLCKDPRQTACNKYDYLKSTDNDKRKENKNATKMKRNSSDQFMFLSTIFRMFYSLQPIRYFHNSSERKRKFFPKDLTFFQEKGSESPTSVHEIYDDDDCPDNRGKSSQNKGLFNEALNIKEAYKVERLITDIPSISDYDVLICTSTVAISGSDIHIYEYGNETYPDITLGHDAAGVVVEVGESIKDLRPGDRVAMESGVACGICEFCKRGAYNMCPKLMYNGFLKKYQAHPADLCHKIPDELCMTEAALTETLALGCQAVFNAGITPTANVLVMGSGATGVASALCARAKGAKDVVVLCTMSPALENIRETFELKCILDEGSGQFTEVLESIFDCFKDWPDVVINCAINERTMNIAGMALKACGICILSQCDTECASFNALNVLMKNIRMVPSFRSANMFPAALQLMNTECVPIGKIIASRYSWDNVGDAFRAAQQESNCGFQKVIVHCGEDDYDYQASKR